MLIGGNPDSHYFYKHLFICLMIVLNAEKREARRSGQKDGGGESAANRSRNVEEVLFLMDPVQCCTYCIRPLAQLDSQSVEAEKHLLVRSYGLAAHLKQKLE